MKKNKIDIIFILLVILNFILVFVIDDRFIMIDKQSIRVDRNYSHSNKELDKIVKVFEFFLSDLTDQQKRNCAYRILDIEKKYKVITREDILAIIKTESNFRHYKNNKVLTSHKGAKGLMQIIPSTARGLASRCTPLRDKYREIITNPEYNLYAGSLYLVLLKQRYKDNNYVYYSYFNGPISKKKISRQKVSNHFYVKRVCKNKEYIKKIMKMF